MHRSADGTWEPDWAETDPDPVPVPTIAWVGWHIGWWWSVTLDHMHGRQPRERTDIIRFGEGAPAVWWLRGLRTEWHATLDGLTDTALDATAPFPWPQTEQPVGQPLWGEPPKSWPHIGLYEQVPPLPDSSSAYGAIITHPEAAPPTSHGGRTG